LIDFRHQNKGVITTPGTTVFHLEVTDCMVGRHSSNHLRSVSACPQATSHTKGSLPSQPVTEW